MPVCQSITSCTFSFKKFFLRLCNAICTTRHWSPELNPEKLAALEAKAMQDIQDLKSEANELKFHTYPETRPFGWEPAQNDIDDDEKFEGEDPNDCGDDNSQFPSQRLAYHAQQAEAAGNPYFESMFGKTMAERLQMRSDLLKTKKRGRPKKSDKSASGTLGPGHVLSQQVNGKSLKRNPNGPSLMALKGVQQRTGGLVNFGSLVETNTIPGRILVSIHF